MEERGGVYFFKINDEYFILLCTDTLQSDLDFQLVTNFFHPNLKL